MLLAQLQKYIVREGLFNSESKLLLAVSGGADSMALLHLMVDAGYQCEVAHVNFHLRGEASDADAVLVKRACAHHKLTLHLHEEDTLAYAKKHKQSIEMAAREIRYQFFAKVMVEQELESVVVAHHRNDIVETFFINLMRGTGLSGLTGIAPINGKIVRPLLWASHQELIDYLEARSLEYAVDQTNFDTTILRNKLRHDIVPDIEELKPGFTDIMQRNVNRLRETEAIVKAYVGDWIQQHTQQRNGDMYISKKALAEAVSPSEILFQLLHTKGFASALIDELATNTNYRVGAMFESAHYRLLVDREYLILTDHKEETSVYYVNKDDIQLTSPISLRFSCFSGDFELVRDASMAFLDLSKLIFPLTLRHWQEGDVFFPIGMKGKKKKISDFFIDRKFSQLQKEQTWLLCSGDDIVWVVGHRLDDRYKVMAHTESVFKIVYGKGLF